MWKQRLLVMKEGKSLFGSRLVLCGILPAGLLFNLWLGGRFKQVSPVDSRYVKRARQTVTYWFPHYQTPLKNTPLPHLLQFLFLPFALNHWFFYALSHFFTCSALWRDFYHFLYVSTLFRGPKTKINTKNRFSEYTQISQKLDFFPTFMVFYPNNVQIIYLTDTVRSKNPKTHFSESG